MADTVRAAILAHDGSDKFTAFSGVVNNELTEAKIRQFAEVSSSLIGGIIDYTRLTATTNVYPSTSVPTSNG